MKGKRQGVRSTRQTDPHIEEPKALDTTKKEKLHDILISIYKKKSICYSYQTGKFPHVSSQGNKYHIVLHDIDSKSTCVETFKNRTEGEMVLGRTRALAHTKLCVITPRHQVLENEASSAYHEAIRHSGMTYRLVLPDKHRRNLEENPIQMWKYHFIGVLCGMAASFPMHSWCQLIPQVEMKLLFMHQAY